MRMKLSIKMIITRPLLTIIHIQKKKMVLEVILSRMRMKSSMKMNLTNVLLILVVLLGKKLTVNFLTPIKERNITNVSQRTMIIIGVH